MKQGLWFACRLKMSFALLGTKLGMSQVYDEESNLVPVTIIQAGPCPVLQVKTSEKDGYAANRYAEEYDRCFEVLERQLEGQEYIVNEYSKADIISWPWILIAKAMGRSLDAYPNVTNWRQRVKERPAVRKGVDLMRAKS